MITVLDCVPATTPCQSQHLRPFVRPNGLPLALPCRPLARSAGRTTLLIPSLSLIQHPRPHLPRLRRTKTHQRLSPTHCSLRAIIMPLAGCDRHRPHRLRKDAIPCRAAIRSCFLVAHRPCPRQAWSTLPLHRSSSPAPAPRGAASLAS